MFIIYLDEDASTHCPSDCVVFSPRRNAKGIEGGSCARIVQVSAKDETGSPPPPSPSLGDSYLGESHGFPPEVRSLLFDDWTEKLALREGRQTH